MTYRIPNDQRRLSQPNNSDVNGNIFATRNIDFDEEGYIRLSDGVISLYSVDDDADFDIIQSMFNGSNVYFLGDDLFRASSLEIGGSLINATSSDTDAPSPGPEEDGVFFNGTEVVSDGGNVRWNNSGTWTAISGTTSPEVGEPTCLGVFPAQNSLLIGIGNTVQRVNSSWTVAQTLTLPADYRVMSIAVNGNYAYIATRHTGNGEAMVFLWLGATTTNDGSYGVGSFEIATIKPYGSSVALMNSLGQLLRFTGSGFEQLAALPVYYSRGDWADASNDYGGISNRGMVVDGDLIYLIISDEVRQFGVRHLQNMPGGVWCYDPKVGLYHKHGATSTHVVSDIDVDTADINTTTDVITVTGITVPATGSPVIYKQAATQIGGLISEKWYYTIKVTDTTFKLAKTREDADNGTAINLTSASDNNAFYFINKLDYGDVVPDDRNSITKLNNTEYESNEIGRIVFSAQPANPTGTTKTRLCAPSAIIENRGYFITPKMFAMDVEDVFNTLTVRYRPLKYGDKIFVKYRDSERMGMPVLPANTNSNSNNRGTWASSTVFTTVANPTTLSPNLSAVEEGDMVEILGGSGAGHIAHVSSIEKSGEQWTVTLDEANPLVSANDVMIFQILDFKRLDDVDHTYEQNWKKFTVDTQSSWVQFLVEMRGTQVSVEDNVVHNRSHARPR